jgi:chromosome segregation ATPase
LGEFGEYVAQYIGDYGLQFGIAVIALTAVIAAWIMPRRRYVKSAEFKRGIDALRLEFRRSIDETRAATVKKATADRANLLSAIKPIDRGVADLNARLARVEDHAGTLEAIVAGLQKQLSEERDRIAARLASVEQRLTALIDQFSLIEQTIDGANRRDQEINYRLITTQERVDELVPRLELGEKARTDLGALVSLFIKQLKRVNINSAETAVRVAELESLRSKVAGLEERLSALLDREKSRLKEESIVTQEAGDRERPPTSIKEGSYGPRVQGGSHLDNGKDDQHPMPLTGTDISTHESAIRG